MNKKKIFISWFLVVLVMGIIFYFSNQEGSVSSGTSNGMSKLVFDNFKLNNFISFDIFHIIFRKMAHFFIYFFLGLFVFNSLCCSFKMSFIKLLFLSIIFVVFYAISDEVHQLFILGRSCEVVDVVIDSCGGCFGFLIYYFYLKIGCGGFDL